MPATSAGSTRSSEMRTVRPYSAASARRSLALFPRSSTRAYASHAYANVSRFRYSMSRSHSFVLVSRRPTVARLQLWKMCAASWTMKSAKGFVLGEVLGRDVAGGLLAQPDEARCVLPEQIGADARQVQVRERPGRAVVAVLEQQRLDVRAREEHDGLLERREHRVLLDPREQPAHHRLDLPARERDGVCTRQRLLRPPFGESPLTSRTSAPRRSRGRGSRAHEAVRATPHGADRSSRCGGTARSRRRRSERGSPVQGTRSPGAAGKVAEHHRCAVVCSGRTVPPPKRGRFVAVDSTTD